MGPAESVQSGVHPDLFPAPDRSTPNWSETAWLGGWSPSTGVGVFAHVGRCPQDLDLWWAQTVVYLPGGRLAMDRSWGRSSDERTVSTGNLVLRIEEPWRRWSMTFDGAAELTTSEIAATRVIGGGCARPLRWQIDAVAAGPQWTMGAAHGDEGDWAGDMHTQQTFHTRGHVIVDGEVIEFDGVGYRDHSRGVRTLKTFGGNKWLIAVLGDISLHAIEVWDVEGRTLVDLGALYQGGSARPVQIRFPDGYDLLGNPRHFDLDLVSPEGAPTLTLGVEVLGVLPFTITEANDNLIGIGWDLPEDPPVFTDSAVRLTTPDGVVGYGHLERSMRRSKAAGVNA